MSGFAAGIISVAALLVGASIIATLVKNPSGSVGLVNAVSTGFNNALIASQGTITSLQSPPSALG